MSIKIMSLVWEHGPADKAEVLVLLAIADYCNDDGECWPSVASIARKARMTERGVQKICARLSETGWLQIDLRQGRYGCNLYRIKTPNFVNPEHGSPRTPEHQTPNPVRQNPEPRSPKPSLTIKEPTETNVSVRRGRRAPSKPLPDDWVPDMAKAQSLMAELDLTRDEMNYCYQQMKGHAHATDRRLANWDQGFANWLRKAVKDGDVGPNSRSRRNSVNGSAFDF